MRHLEKTLEEIKRMGNYSVTCFYGEETGCDDIGDPMGDRNLTIYGTPVGFLGEVRLAWVGKLSEMAFADLNTKPTPLSNPPGKVPRERGIYVWGIESSVEHFMKKRFPS